MSFYARDDYFLVSSILLINIDIYKSFDLLFVSDPDDDELLLDD